MDSSPSQISNMSGFLIFISGIMSAICLGLMTYTFVTGKLPLGIKPMIEMPKEEVVEGEEVAEGETPAVAAADKAPEAKDEKDKDKSEKAKEEEAEYLDRPGESFALELYKQLEDARKQLQEERKKLADEQEKLKVQKEVNQNLEAALKKRTDAATKLIDQIKATELDNVKKVADVITSSELAAAAKMILDLDLQLAARVLYVMSSKKSGELMSELSKETDPAKEEKIKELLKRVHQISDKEIK